MSELDDFFGNMFRPNSRLHQKTRHYVVRDIEPGSLFEHQEETYLDERGLPQKTESATAYIAGCGHYVFGPKELSGVCSKCGTALCCKCSVLYCRRCLSMLCRRHAKIVDGSTVYCSKCRTIVYGIRLFKGFFKLLWWAVSGLFNLLSRKV